MIETTSYNLAEITTNILIYLQNRYRNPQLGLQTRSSDVKCFNVKCFFIYSLMILNIHKILY